MIIAESLQSPEIAGKWGYFSSKTKKNEPYIPHFEIDTSLFALRRPCGNNSILNLTGADVVKKLTHTDLAIIPFGSIEYHGPHAALGTDSFIAEELGKRVGGKLNATLCPLIAYTACPVRTQPNPGTIHVDPDVMTAYIEAIFRGFFQQGLKGLLAA